MLDFILFSLAITDCLLIIDSCITKSIIPNWANTDGIEPYWFRVSFPAFWHPFKGIIVTITIYMVVAVSAERFRAVCHPLSKRHVSSYLHKSFVYIYELLFIFNLQTIFNLNSFYLFSVSIQIRFCCVFYIVRIKIAKVLSIQIGYYE